MVPKAAAELVQVKVEILSLSTCKKGSLQSPGYQDIGSPNINTPITSTFEGALLFKINGILHFPM